MHRILRILHSLAYYARVHFCLADEKWEGVKTALVSILRMLLNALQATVAMQSSARATRARATKGYKEGVELN
jgi:hypothetical protein